ncbi:MAG: hypothetical protein R2867_28325 [Caldilineaceae bacterium]
MARVCKPDGQILLFEHGRSRWGWLAWIQDRTAQSHYNNAGCRWNQDPLALVRAAGLQLVEAERHLAGVFHTIMSRVRPFPETKSLCGDSRSWRSFSRLCRDFLRQPNHRTLVDTIPVAELLIR